MILRKAVEQYQIRLGVEKIRDGALSGKIDIEQLHGEEKSLAEAINNIGEGLLHAVDDSTKNERMKADLITNVSHDIKTPLTSIINYVNLMKLEKIDNERVQGYIKILDEKSQRLKQLTADLVEASKISSGNVKLDMQVIDLVELVYQTSGEFNEKFEQKELTIVNKNFQKTAVLIRARWQTALPRDRKIFIIMLQSMHWKKQGCMWILHMWKKRLSFPLRMYQNIPLQGRTAMPEI